MCPECASSVHRLELTLLGIDVLEKEWAEESLLHQKAFSDTHHSPGHVDILHEWEDAEKTLNIRTGYRSETRTNDSFTYSLNGKVVSVYPIHQNATFANAFGQLRTTDRAWAAAQWNRLSQMMVNLNFPEMLLPFKTNKKEQALFHLLQFTNLATAEPRDTNEFPLPNGH
jgi:hypothetical protein